MPVMDEYHGFDTNPYSNADFERLMKHYPSTIDPKLLEKLKLREKLVFGDRDVINQIRLGLRPVITTNNIKYLEKA